LGWVIKGVGRIAGEKRVKSIQLDKLNSVVRVESIHLLVETDYVGIVNGKRTDKSGVFNIFYGEPAQ